MNPSILPGPDSLVNSFGVVKVMEKIRAILDGRQQIQIVREAWVLHDARDITNMEQNHRNVVGFVHLASFYGANDISINSDVDVVQPA